MIDYFTGLPRTLRRLLLLVLDSVVVIVAVWAAFAIRLGEWWPDMLAQAVFLMPISLALVLPICWGIGLYRSVLRYAGYELFYTIFKGVTIAVLLVIASWAMLRIALVPRAVWFIYWFIVVALISGSRLLLRDYLLRRFAGEGIRKPVIIYGAGVAGVQLAMALRHDPEYSPVAFVDDNTELQGSVVLGLKVSAPDQLARLIERDQAEAVLLAIPSASRRQRRNILAHLTGLPVRLMVMPSLTELASGTKRIDDLRAVDVEDILGRDPIKPHPVLLAACIRNKAVLVTGAGGSIGTELCRQIIQLGPRRLVLFEVSEFALYRIEQELRTLCKSLAHPPELIAVLGSISHRKRMKIIMQQYRVQTVYHTAAYKHVTIVEANPIEGVQNNIFGTYYTALAAAETNVETFVFISTDKAVRPSNVMGATKRLAELVLQGMARQAYRTRFCIVRFGNVLASSGSVVPLFREQIREGGPVTVTDPEVTRYFMTIPEAAQLVIQAGSMAQGGEVFLLDMGEPVKIVDLARRLIELSGLRLRDEHNPDGDIEIVFTGLRSGEKLHEELLIGDVNEPTDHPMIKRAHEESLPWLQVQRTLERLTQASKHFDYALIDELLRENVAGYCGAHPEEEAEDTRQRQMSG
ncbi:MAG: polysaccharide biosynthesis protein [Candidatus Competibacteraceae bacterium]|nr:polysaccharide biosynthesis protein [Candidatus Competibacteraceae bacterium]MCB1804435.1 polysaccharide biosynthesis protein [Candidatus Competibacteraceae bacterium]